MKQRPFITAPRAEYFEAWKVAHFKDVVAILPMRFIPHDGRASFHFSSRIIEANHVNNGERNER